jgi:hypothetical protein
LNLSNHNSPNLPKISSPDRPEKAKSNRMHLLLEIFIVAAAWRFVSLQKPILV